MNLFIADAVAATTAPAPAYSETGFSMIMVLAIFVLFYFMLIRPQQKRVKEHRDMMSKIKKGDEVLTNGGLLGRVTGVDEQYVKLALTDAVEILLQKSAVGTILPKGTMKSLKI